MAIYSPRTRLVNFRLSEDEYQTLKDAAVRQGARSISDFARAAILTSVGNPKTENGQADLSNLDRKVSEIQGTVERISGILSRVQTHSHAS
ncbi:plasmid mobilization protein [Nevskia soli]|jgi:hypothetical protein|uniref:plasmid mobilization protein n=1 Tax=Nevskia soli TaxID=418856 RepID=UPI0015D757C9|nr:hypothetical protein [Nevskia soli]